jgi:methylthioribose-1-phosphate isomerase
MENKFVQSVKWEGNSLVLLDQRMLPEKVVFEKMETIEDVWDGIKHMKVRGAPAIGIAAAYGLYLGIRDLTEDSFDGFYNHLKEKSNYLASSRPTAVNLFWALERMEKRAQREKGKDIQEIKTLLLQEAHDIRNEDEIVCKNIGENLLELLEDGMAVLTHCNAGGIATAKYGTALAPIYLAKERGLDIKVFADETRPVLQGSRLTAWELMEAGIDVTLICDNMAAMVMAKAMVNAVIVGCDRVAANGDVANKIGTYGLSILAKEHNIPFYVAAPTSTIDMLTGHGKDIEIEERSVEEITGCFGKVIAPEGVKGFNPAFDVTPHKYITAIVTEKGVIYPPFEEGLKKIFEV